MKKFIYLVASTVPLLVLGYFLWQKVSIPKPTGLRPVTLKIDWVPTPEYYGFFYAKEKGLFRDAGFEVTIEYGNGAAGLAKELAVGAIDFGTTTSDNLLRELLDGASIRAAVPLFRYNPSSISLRDDKRISSNRSISALKELRGMTIGTNQQASPYPQFLYALSLAGMTAADIREYPIGWGGPAELADRRADGILAYSTNGVVDLELQNQSFQEIMLGDVGVESYGLVFVASKRSVNNRLSNTDVMTIFRVVKEGYARGTSDIEGSVDAIRAAAPTQEPTKIRAAIRKIKLLNESTAYEIHNLDRWVTTGRPNDAVRQRFEALMASKTGDFYQP